MQDYYKRSLDRQVFYVFTLGLVLAGGVGGWASFASLSSAVIAAGTVAVENNVKAVQHRDGGIVEEVAVTEGERVKAGQLLVKLDGTLIRANLSIVNNTLAQLYIRRARLFAEQTGAVAFEVPRQLPALVSPEAVDTLRQSEFSLFDTRRQSIEGMRQQLLSRKDQITQEMSGIQVQVSAYSDQLGVLRGEIADAERLLKKGLTVSQRVTSLRKDEAEIRGYYGAQVAALAQARGRQDEIDLQILQLSQDRSSEVAKDLTELEGKITEYEDRRIAAADQLRRIDIRSPVSGRVYQLATHTVGGVIGAGETLMMVVPDNDALMVEAKISTHDIDQVHVGQAVSLRFSAFNQQTTPEVDARISTVAPDLVTDQKSGISYYPLRIEPDRVSLQKLRGLSLYPGMPVEIFIKTGERTAASYIFKPLSDQIRHSLREE